jgi:anti-sigma factor RsiW
MIRRLHPDDEDLAHYVDGLLDSESEAEIQRHTESCSRCREIVDALRRGLVMLALASRPPEGLYERIRALRMAGHRAILPPERANPDLVDLPEVVGRDADAGDAETPSAPEEESEREPS